MIVLTINFPGVIKPVLKTVSLDESTGAVEDIVLKEPVMAFRKTTLSDDVVKNFIKTPVEAKLARAWKSMPRKAKIAAWVDTYDVGYGVKWEEVEC